MMQDIKDSRNNRIGYMNVLTGRIEVYLNGKGRIGYIDNLNPNEHRAYNARNQKIAKWQKFDDYTYDANNRKIGKGDMLLDLLIQSV